MGSDELIANSFRVSQTEQSLRNNNINKESEANKTHFRIGRNIREVIKNINCTVISVTIDLYEYLKKAYLYNVYETAFDFLLERYIYATKNNKKGIIMLEARGNQEDSDLLKHISNVIDNAGRKNIPTTELQDKIKDG